MSTLDSVRKLVAFDVGRPLRRGKTILLPKRPSAETLILAFVRMGGESRPWGVAIGAAKGAPHIFTVPEARDRELVGAMLERMAPHLLAHMGHPQYSKRTTRLPHVWLPNSSHIEMLHFLAFTYTFARRGETERLRVLNALGRAANWLFQESSRPGQVSCIDASAALRDAFTFPCDNTRQAHTGYLLAWLDSRGSFEKRLSHATAAEQLTVSTSLDPQIEKSGLDKLVERFNEAKRANNADAMRLTEARIRAALEPELRRRFDVTARAFNLLRDDTRPVNAGVADLEKPAEDQYAEYIKIERQVADGQKAWIQSPETDRNTLVAASRYISIEADSNRFTNALVHSDADLQEELLIAGDGLKGRIVAIKDESEGRKTRAIWIVEEDSRRPLRLRVGDRLTQAGYPKRKAELRQISERRTSRRSELEIVNGIRAEVGPLGRDPLDKSWVGKNVAFLSLSDPGFAFMKRKMLWERSGPGTWLTHRQMWDLADSSGGEDDNDSGPVVA